jgi:hypothetical protein
MCGSVASPTPTMPISLDSIRRICSGFDPNTELNAAAVIHPAVPPPTITILNGEGTRGFLCEKAGKKKGAPYRTRRAPLA